MIDLQSQREEIASAATHGLGVVLAVGGGAALITQATLHAGARELVGVSVFVAALVLLYTASTLYHLARRPEVKSRLKILDHCAIFVLIAGTYTPFTIAAMRGGWGWSLFGVIWGLAVVGIVLKLFFTGRFRYLSTATYIGMGWLVVVAFVPLTEAVTPSALGWLIAGGISYTAGTLFYHNHRLPYSHAIWHLFVLGGSTCHFAAVALEMLGPPAVIR
ncbi:PAQR family membrane homeostasis protein TrhA [Wenzhouxiangella limi]|uniref:Hemolysin III family protein n=1 Tax=Wenzhouxiangella limi TaxID=2707351 RepID=A0A845UYA1_9GAMM|nr:hemolysin III family protein [Wenzhouxiangella limi]NDY96397.1 hemolysin III family protein [Wenzhouxiangella limi]